MAPGQQRTYLDELHHQFLIHGRERHIMLVQV